MRRHVRAEGAQVWALLQRGRRRRRVGAVRASGEAEGTRMPHADRDVVLRSVPNKTANRYRNNKAITDEEVEVEVIMTTGQ